MGGACSTYRSMRNAYIILPGKSEVKDPLDGPRRRWEYIKMAVKRTVC